MAIRKIDEIVKIGTHPLEEFFDIEAGTTETVTTHRRTEPAEYEPYDGKDKEIEEDYQMVLDSAMDMVDMLKGIIDGGTDARFIARLSEVTGQQLNIALAAADKKAKLKDNKDKFEHKKATGPGSKTINHNNMTIVMDRNQMLEAVLSRPYDVIDAEVEEVPSITKEE